MMTFIFVHFFSLCFILWLLLPLIIIIVIILLLLFLRMCAMPYFTYFSLVFFARFLFLSNNEKEKKKKRIIIISSSLPLIYYLSFSLSLSCSLLIHLSSLLPFNFSPIFSFLVRLCVCLVAFPKFSLFLVYCFLICTDFHSLYL